MGRGEKKTVCRSPHFYPPPPPLSPPKKIPLFWPGTCNARGQAWAFNPEMSYYRCGTDGLYPDCTPPADLTAGIDTASARLLDPAVLGAVPVGHNATVGDAAASAFAGLWAGTSAATSSPADMAAAWATLLAGEGVFADLAVEPVFFGACASPACVGVAVQSQLCVCPE